MAHGLSISAAKRIATGAAFLAMNVAAMPALAFHSCILIADDIAFGSYSVINSTEVDSSAELTFACSGTDDIRIRGVVEISTGASGSFAPRTMTNGTATLNYNIYRNNNRTRIWGDGTGGSETRRIGCNLRGQRTSCSTTRAMHGRIPAGQNVPAGTYSDILIVTLTY